MAVHLHSEEELFALLESDDSREVGLGLSSCGERESVDARTEAKIVNLIQHSDPYIRFMATTAASDLRLKRAIPAIIGGLKDVHSPVRLISCKAIASLLARKAEPYILPLIQDVRPIVAYTACDCLGAMGKADARVSTLAEQLRRESSVREILDGVSIKHKLPKRRNRRRS